MRARIFQRPKTAMQSGVAGTAQWVLEFAFNRREVNDPLMGWTGRGDTLDQVRLQFDTREDAIAHAEKNGYAYDVEIPPAPPKHKPKVYADNFRFGRSENWTH
jgi:ETC complex I subunit conserved region